MNKKGFTLIELLAVIVILAVIALIVTPVVTGIISSAKDQANKRSAESYIKAAENYYAAATLDQTKKDKLGLANLINDLELSNAKAIGWVAITKEGKIDMAIIIDNKCYKKTTYQTVAEMSIDTDLDNCEGSIGNYAEEVLNGADPILTAGLIPVIISPTGVVTKVNPKQEWYKYSESKWANAVLVDQAKRSEYRSSSSGTQILSSDIKAYFVWIPRYKYQIFNAAGTDSTTPGTINIIFENSETSQSVRIQDNEWLTSPAFTFGTKNLNGFWIGKFETTGTTDAPTILPGIASLKKINLSEGFTISQKFNDLTTYGINMDAHLSKNSEWGAVAYLSHSPYGKYNGTSNTEVYINNNNKGYTGCGGDTAIAVQTSTCINSFGSLENNIYPQSTTGNITGVFDMSGGADELVMDFAIDNNNSPYTFTSSGFTELPDSKYYDTHKVSELTACDGNLCFGKALTETRNWYDDAKQFSTSAYYTFTRSGNYTDAKTSGIFHYDMSTGGSSSLIGFRVILAN